MAIDNESNFGNADGGGTVDVNDDGGNAATVADPGGPSDPASFTKRGRGRPRKSDAGGDAGGATSAGQQSGKAKSQASKKLDVSLFAKQLQGAHAMLAMLTKNPLWNIDDSAAASLAQALLDVMVHHSINVNPATLSYVKLFGICAAIYGPRLMIMKMHADARKREEATTIDMPT